MSSAIGSWRRQRSRLRALRPETRGNGRWWRGPHQRCRLRGAPRAASILRHMTAYRGGAWRMLRYHRTEGGRSIAAGWAFASVDPRRARSLQFAILLLAMLVFPVRPLGAAAQSNPDAATGPVIVTFATPDGSTFRTLLEQPADVAAVRAALAGDGYAGIPNGALAYGDGGINAPHGWHMQGTTLADVTIELCDGTASMVDEDLTYWVETVGQVLPVVCHGRRRRAREPARRRRGAGQRRRWTRHRRGRRRWSGQRIRRRRARRRDRHRRRCCGCRRYRRHRRGRRRRASEHRCRHGADWVWWHAAGGGGQRDPGVDGLRGAPPPLQGSAISGGTST